MGPITLQTVLQILQDAKQVIKEEWAHYVLYLKAFSHEENVIVLSVE